MSTSTHMSKKDFWSISPQESLDLLKSDNSRGLSQGEADKRILMYGKNTIQLSRVVSPITILLRQFKSPLILILLIASGVTFVISHYQDAVFILVAVIVNTLLGFYQEHKAERALSELKTYLKPRTRVVRDGREFEIDTEELVSGDVVRLAQGDRVPADGRIIFANDLQVDEAVLTGESLPVTKKVDVLTAVSGLGDQKNMVFAGTLVTQGVATVVVSATGLQTEFGKIATLITVSENDETPLQKAIKKFSIQSSIFLSALTFVVFGIGLLAQYSFVDMFLIAVAMAVSAIPEGLPVALTVILAVGVQRMAKRKGVVRKLIAAETLGSASIILTDKTGTLTMARMDLTEVIPFNLLGEVDLLRMGLTNTQLLIENPDEDPQVWRMNGRVMENALVRGAGMRGVRNSDTDAFAVIQSVPFNSVYKFSMALIKKADKYLVIFFGAPDMLLARTKTEDSKKAELLRSIHDLASTGKRVLGIAHKEVELSEGFSLAHTMDLSDLTIDGLLTFNDPVRPGVIQAIKKVGDAGIKTVVMTGDHAGTAQAIARTVGLPIIAGSCIDGSELALLSDKELLKRLPIISVISRVTPFDKLRIAKLYQSLGEVVAMTGDGVNDAPAIKQANVGIAMGSGTEVSRTVADLVLLDDNFETIVAAIEEGRQIMGNIRKVLVYLLSNVLDGLILIGGSLLVGLPLPLNALQILWVNFFSDSFPAIAFAFERESSILCTRIVKGNLSLFDPLMKFLILIIGVSTSVLLFALYWILLHAGFDEALVKTFIFASFGTYTLCVAFPVRGLDKSIFSYPFFSNWYMLGGIFVGFVLMALAVYLPFFQSLFDTVSLPLPWLIAVFGVGLFNVVVIEIGKWVFRKKTR